MQFVVIGRDGKDSGAQDRRARARDAHLAGVEAMRAAGTMLFGVALLDDEGKMCGSVMTFDFPDRAAFDAWFAQEPYVTGKVWENVEVSEGRVAPSFQKKA